MERGNMWVVTIDLNGETSELLRTGDYHLAEDACRQAYEDHKERPDIYGMPTKALVRDRVKRLYRIINDLWGREPTVEDEGQARAVARVSNRVYRRKGSPLRARVEEIVADE